MVDSEEAQIPKFSEMFAPILRALKDRGESMPAEDLDREVIRIMAIPKGATEVLHSGSRNRTEVSYRLAWARTYLKKYGSIENPERGKWRLPDDFDGEPEDIDSEDIVRTVRNQNIIDFKNAAASELERSDAFEQFALSALQNYARVRSEEILVKCQQQKVSFDAMLPNGIAGERGKTFVEIKMDWNASAKQYLADIGDVLAENDCFLLVLCDRITDEKKHEMQTEIQSSLSCRVMLWDYDDLLKYVIDETGDVGHLSTPRRILAEAALLHKPDVDKQRKTKEERLDQLKQAYRAGKLTLCLGSGVSHNAGIPLWKDLIRELLVLMIDYKTQGEAVDREELTRITKLAATKQEESPLTQVRYIRAAFEKVESEAYYELVRKVLYQNEIEMDAAILNAISRLSDPKSSPVGIKGIITYNFDDLLERKLKAEGIKYNVVYREKDQTDNSSLNIYHVHGFLPHDKESSELEDTALIFSEEDYHEVYRDAYCWSNITQLNAFRENVCLFIGCSLTDPNIRRLLDISVRSFDEPRHFAIMRRKAMPEARSSGVKNETLEAYQRIDNNIREAYFHTLGIDVIWVDSFNELPTILSGLLRE